MIFDTHCHYTSRQYEEDLEDVLARIHGEGVARAVTISTNMDDIVQNVKLAERIPWMYAAVGLHPTELEEIEKAEQESEQIQGFDFGKQESDQLQESWFGKRQIMEYAAHEKAVAIGEIGLDYYWMESPKEVQKKWFLRQLELSKELKLPINVHSRDAAQDTFDMIKEYHAGTTGGIIHCYSGSLEMAREYVKLGYHLGIGGVVTFKNSKTLKRVVEEIPLEYLVTETDCPYLTPIPYRGKRNMSSYIRYVIDEIARLKHIEPEEAQQALWDNANRVYHLDADIRSGQGYSVERNH